MEVKERNGKWQDFVNYCFDLYDEAKASSYRSDKLKSIKEAYRVYKQKESPNSPIWPNASAIELPLFTITVDNVEPRIAAGLTGKKPFVDFAMDGLTEKDELTKILEDWFNQELENTVDINNVASKVVHKVLFEGDVYPIITYDEDEVTRRDFVFNESPKIDPKTGTPALMPNGEPQIEKVLGIDEDGNAITQDVIDTIFKGGRITFAEYSDVFVADIDKEWEKTDVIRVVRPTYAELQRKKGTLGYIDDNIGDFLLPEEVKEKSEKSPEEEVNEKTVTGNEVIECLECCVSYVYKEEDQSKEDVTDWTEKRYVGLITKDTKVILRMTELIDLNFKNEHLVKRVRLFPDGSSMYDKMKSIQTGSTDLFNMVVNVATITMIPWFLYSDAAGFDGDAKIIPGQGIRVDDPSQVAFPKFSQNPRSYMIFIEMFLKLWEKLGSVSDIQVGRIQDGSSDVTATETMAAIQEGNIKHNYQGLSLKRDFIAMLRTIYDLYYQKMPYDAEFTYHGQKIKVPRAEMRRRHKFVLKGSSDMSNKVMQMKKSESMYKSLRSDPLANGLKLIEDVVSSHREEADAKEYINPMITQLLNALKQNPELPQVIQQYMQGKQQQQAQGEQAQQLNMAQATGKTIAKEMQNA